MVLFEGDNDLQPGGCEPFDRQYEHCHADLVRRALGFELPPLRRSRSVLVERLRAALGRPVNPWAAADPGLARHPRLAPGALAAFASNVRSQIGIARANGARVALVTQAIRIRRVQRVGDLAYLGQWLPGLLPAAAPGELERLNGALRLLGREDGVQLVDAAARIRWQDDDFADPLHFSARGSERFSDFLAAELQLPAGAP